MKESFEPTLPGNPYQLIKNQHIFPAFAIRKFCKEGKVRIWERGKNVVDKGANAATFITLRKWDHGTEKALADIDANYAVIVEKYTQRLGKLDPVDNQRLTVFYASWFARWKLSQEVNTPIVLHGIPPDNVTKELQEEGEVGGVATSQNRAGECVVPSRFIYGDQLQQWCDRIEKEHIHTQWWSGDAGKTSLFVPDVMARTYIPFTPSRFFVGLPSTDTPRFSPQTGETMNRMVMECYHQYYFGYPTGLL